MRRCRIESLGVSAPRKGWLRWGALRHAVTAGKRCLEGSHHRREDVRLLVNAGVYRDDHVCEPAIAAYIQHRLDINIEFQGRRTLAFDLTNGACGMLSALQVVTALLQDGEGGVGLVVSSEANTDRRPSPSYTYPASGAAVLVELSPRAELGFGPFATHTQDEHQDLFRAVVSLKEKRGRLLLENRQKELEEAWLACAPKVVSEALEKAGLRREEIDLVIPAQISGEFLGRLPQAIGFPPDHVANLSARLADTHSTSVILALDESLKSGQVGPGKTALLLAFGAGVNAVATTYRF